MRKTTLALAVALSCLLAPTHAAVQPLPEDVIAVVELPNVVATAPRLQQTAGQIQPGTVVPPVHQVAAVQLLKTQNPQTVDLSKPLRMVLLAPPRHMFPVTVFAVPDAAAYLESLRPNIQKQEEVDGVHVYQEESAPFGLGVPAPPKPLCIGTVGQKAVMGSSPVAVRSVMALVAGGNLPEEPFFEGDAGAAVRLRKLLADLDAAGQNPFNQFKALAQAAQPGAPSQAASMEAIVDAYQAMAEQLEVLTGQIAFEPDATMLTFTVKPAAGSAIESYVNTVPSGELRLLKYMPADATMVCAWRSGDISGLLEWYTGWLGKMYGALGMDAETVNQFAGMMNLWKDVMGGEIAVAMSAAPGGPMTVVEALTVGDVEKARKAVATMLKDMPELMPAQPGVKMAFEANPKAASHAGHDIDQWSFTMEFEPIDDTEAARAMAETQGAMIRNVWGEKMQMCSTFIGADYVFTVGPDGLDSLKRVIDGDFEPVVGSQRLADALEGMPEDPMAVACVSLGDLANWYLGVLEAMPLPLSLEQIRFESGPPVGIAAYVTDGGVVEKRVRVPHGAVRAIVQGVQNAFVGMQGPPPVQTAPQPATP